jgi:transcriptional regulator with XRE-family HTH domain
MSSLEHQVAINLRRLRKARNLTGQQLANLTTSHPRGTLSRHAISQIENRHRRVTVDELAALAQVFHVAPWSLTQPWLCPTCNSAPPAGYRCLTCGAERTTST